MEDAMLISILALWVILGLVSGGIWSSKGGEWFFGALLGLVLGVFGLAYVAFARPRPRVWSARGTMRECPHCLEPMRREAPTCPHCHRDSEPWHFHEGRWWIKDDIGWRYLDPWTDELVTYDGPASVPHTNRRGGAGSTSP